MRRAGEEEEIMNEQMYDAVTGALDAGAKGWKWAEDEWPETGRYVWVVTRARPLLVERGYYNKTYSGSAWRQAFATEYEITGTVAYWQYEWVPDAPSSLPPTTMGEGAGA